MKRLAIVFFAGIVALLFIGTAVAQSAYPSKTIRVVSPYAAGGSSPVWRPTASAVRALIRYPPGTCTRLVGTILTC